MVSFRRSLAGLFMALFLTGGLWPAAHAQTPYEDDSYASVPSTAEDPPGRVGRVSLLSGTVSWREAEEAEWTPAVLNYPVTNGNAFWAEPGARAELRIGGDSLRLDGGTEVDIEQLDDLVTRVTVPQGIINLHVETRDPNEVYQVVTPRGTVSLVASGTYRIDAGTETTPTAVAVLRGSARFADGHAVTITRGETVFTSGNEGAVSYAVQKTVPNEFDNWSLARDNYEEPREEAKYVSPEMTGYEDLGTYGQWQTVPEYGNVWYPTAVPVGWAPYRYGHWAWILPWGWTWIDDAPWGFAPFHFGRWFFLHDRWAWWPGERHHRPVFAPALVAFVGGHDHRFGVGLGGPAIGWVPLAPHEAFRPYFHASSRFERDVNINTVRNGNVARVTAQNVGHANYANRNFATIVPQDDFTGGHHAGRAALHVPAENLAAAPVATSAAMPVIRGRAAEVRGAVPTPVPAAMQRFEGRPGKQFLPERERIITPSLTGATVASPVREAAAPSQPRTNLITGTSLQTTPAPHRVERRETVVPQAAQPVVEPREVTVPQPHRVERREVVTPQQQRQQIIERSSDSSAQAPAEREQQVRPTPREIAVPHPEQSRVLTPSREGWVRQPPAVAAPRTQPAPAAAPSAQPAPAPAERAAPAPEEKKRGGNQNDQRDQRNDQGNDRRGGRGGR